MTVPTSQRKPARRSRKDIAGRAPVRLKFCDLPAKDAPPLEVLAWLANVDPGLLEAALSPLWRDGDERTAAIRLDNFRCAVSLQATAARKAAPRKGATADARELVDELVSKKTVLTKTAAFEWVADDRGIKPESVRNAYYSDHP
jgi:hypothetical protein